MKGLKKLVALVALSSLSFSYLSFQSLNLPTCTKLTKRNHPKIDGFTYEGGEEKDVYVSGGSSGYRNYDSDYYYSQVTDVSRLYIIHVQVNFIPGCIPHYSGHSEYDINSKLVHGYIHILPYQKKENYFKKSSSFTYIRSWPCENTKSLTSQTSSSYSTSYNYSSSLGAGVDLTDGVKLTVSASAGITTTFSTQTIITGSEPRVSHVDSPGESTQQEWIFNFNSYYGGNYRMDCYYRMEVKNDGIVYSSYSFDYQIDYSRTTYSSTTGVFTTTNQTSYGFYGTY